MATSTRGLAAASSRHAGQKVTDMHFWVWAFKAHIKHWFGFHTMVPHETMHEGMTIHVGEICWFCDYERS